MKEIWKPFPFNTLYSISNLGRVKGPKGIGYGSKNNKGYMQKVIRINGIPRTFRVHRLVLICFLGERSLDSNHKNGIKHDNRLSNLEYVTRSENVLHAYRTGLSKLQCGENCSSAKLTWKKVRAIRKDILSTNRELAKKFGVSDVNISRIRHGDTWKENRAFEGE